MLERIRRTNQNARIKLFQKQTLMPEMEDNPYDSEDGSFSGVANDYYYISKTGFNVLLKWNKLNNNKLNKKILTKKMVGKPDLPEENNKTDQNKPIGHEETPQEQLNRISKGDIRDQDIFEAPGIAVYPVPNPKTFK